MSHKIDLTQFKSIYVAACTDWKNRLLNAYAREAIFDSSVTISEDTLADMRKDATPTQSILLNEIFGKVVEWEVGQLVKLVEYPEGDHWTKGKLANLPLGYPLMINIAKKTLYCGGKLLVSVCTLEGTHMGGIPDHCIKPFVLAKPTGRGHNGLGK
tara:strand:- start:46 stop:513 length:468 start_codon:yes stop_codon:yes gene_type:complete